MSLWKMYKFVRVMENKNTEKVSSVILYRSPDWYKKMLQREMRQHQRYCKQTSLTKYYKFL